MNLFRAFYCAFRGIAVALKSQRNMRIHAVIFVLVLGLGFFCSLSVMQWLLVLLCSALVLMAECFNSAIEGLVDAIWPGYHARARDIKDLSAAAVLITAMLATVVGGLIFIPKLIKELF